MNTQAVLEAQIKRDIKSCLSYLHAKLSNMTITLEIVKLANVLLSNTECTSCTEHRFSIDKITLFSNVLIIKVTEYNYLAKTIIIIGKRKSKIKVKIPKRELENFNIEAFSKLLTVITGTIEELFRLANILYNSMMMSQHFAPP